MSKIIISGYERECNCEHCGRSLVHGIKTNSGIVGATCFVKALVNTKMSANSIIELAKMAEKYSAETLAHSFNIHAYTLSFEAKSC